MALYYKKDAILWTYRHIRPKKNNPTEEDLRDWDTELYKKYEKTENTLEKLMRCHNIKTSKAKKSHIVALAQVSKGTDTEINVANACKFYANNRTFLRSSLLNLFAKLWNLFAN